MQQFHKTGLVAASRGVITFGLPRSLVSAALAKSLNAGFHGRLAPLSPGQVRTHPWSPLPDLRR